MARKKKNVDEYPWSPYQEAIYDYIRNGNGHLVVEASAGAGKTTTLVHCIKIIPREKKILLSAFNQDIVKELKKRTKGFDNVDVRTLHSLGLLFLRRWFGDCSLVPDVFKYDAYIRENISSLSSMNLRSFSRRDYIKYLGNIKKYVDFGRFYLAKGISDLRFIEERYGIETMGDEMLVALNVMEWGKTSLDIIDYTDMIWIPNVLNLFDDELMFDFVMVDECQDLNKAERELLLRCFKENTRLISVGDEWQAIYAFSGSDSESFSILKSLPNTKSLPLSISYRCAKNIVNFARNLVPTIEYKEDAVDGIVAYDCKLDEVKDGDMILCRNNAPLVKVYADFLKMGKKAFIRGKDIGTNLKTLVKSTKKDELNVSCMKDGVFVRLYEDLFSTRDKIMARHGIGEKEAYKSQEIQSRIDMISTLEVLSEGINNSDDLIEKIDSIFSDKKKDGISLSTVHKAKGLEAENVYIICNSLMPSKSAEKEWERRQERNLMYVAYTRPKNKLGFVDEKGFEKFGQQASIAHLKAMEEVVKDTLSNGKRKTFGPFRSDLKAIEALNRGTKEASKRKPNALLKALKR